MFSFDLGMIKSLSQCHCENKLENVGESLRRCLVYGGGSARAGSTHEQAVMNHIG